MPKQHPDRGSNSDHTQDARLDAAFEQHEARVGALTRQMNGMVSFIRTGSNEQTVRDSGHFGQEVSNELED
jgi:hypothetical protein